MTTAVAFGRGAAQTQESPLTSITYQVPNKNQHKKWCDNVNEAVRDHAEFGDDERPEVVESRSDSVICAWCGFSQVRNRQSLMQGASGEWPGRLREAQAFVDYRRKKSG